MNRVSRNTVYKNGFREAYDMIPIEDQISFSRGLQDRMVWSQATYYNRMKGISPTKLVEKERLEAYFMEYGIDLHFVMNNN